MALELADGFRDGSQPCGLDLGANTVVTHEKSQIISNIVCDIGKMLVAAMVKSNGITAV